MTEHTALPWHASQKSVYVSDIHHRVIAEMHRNGEERVANAAFIVKAVTNHDPLVKALQAIIEANSEFRLSLPKDWDGDPLQDAINEAAGLLGRVGGPGNG